MEKFVESVAKRYFDEHREEFGENAVFQGFIAAEGPLTVQNRYPCTAFGYLAYQVGDDVRISNRLRVQYLISDLAIAQSRARLWFASEVTFYSLVWPNIRAAMATDLPQPRLVPKFYASGSVWRPMKLAEAAVFESPRAHYTWGHSRRLNLRHLELMARKIGQFHGCALRQAAIQQQQLLMHEPAAAPELYSDYLCRVMQPRLQHCLEPLYADPLYTTDSDSDSDSGTDTGFVRGVKRMAAKIAHLSQGIAEAFNGPANCRLLCHMNYSQASVFFKYEGTEPVDALIGNWAMADYCSLGADLVILLFVEGNARWDQELRRHLICAYYQELKRYSPPECCPPLAQVVFEIKRCVPIALFALAARVNDMVPAPCLSMRTNVSPHWDDKFVTSILKSLIVNRYV